MNQLFLINKISNCKLFLMEIPNIKILLNEVKAGNFLLYINYFTRSKEIINKLFDYIRNTEPIKIDIDKIDYIYSTLFCLSILIESKENDINFMFDYDLIKFAYEKLIQKELEEFNANPDYSGHIRLIICLKIIYDLIDNYERSLELGKIQQNTNNIDLINEIKKEIHSTYEKIENNKSRNYHLRNLDISKELRQININTIYSKAIENLFLIKDFTNYAYIANDLLDKKIFVDIETIKNIKSIIDDENYHEKFLLNLEDLNYLVNFIDPDNLKEFHKRAEKIHFLNILVIFIFKDRENFKGCPYLIKTCDVLNNIYCNKDVVDLFIKADFPLLKKLKDIMSILNNLSRSIFEGSTRINTNIINNNENDESERKINYFKYHLYDINIPQNDFGIDSSGSKLFRNILINSFSQNNYNNKYIEDMESLMNNCDIDYIGRNHIENADDLISRDFKYIKDIEKIKDYIDIFDIMNKDFLHSIEVIIFIYENDKEIKIILRSADKVYKYLFETSNSEELKIIGDFCSGKNFIIIN